MKLLMKAGEQHSPILPARISRDIFGRKAQLARNHDDQPDAVEPGRAPPLMHPSCAEAAPRGGKNGAPLNHARRRSGHRSPEYADGREN